MDNLAAGLEAMFARSSMKHVASEGRMTETTAAIGPWIRYYYTLEKIYPFAEFELTAGESVEKIPTSGGAPDLYRYYLFNTGLSLGVAVPLADMVTFDIMAGYMRSCWRMNATTGEMEAAEIVVRYINPGPFIRMGFTVYL
ncbi:MAG: hypothetical protein GX622_04560 [Bacteroidales bacterium]|jgi:hypothetical protein|nr:hypothetical protein [Bacteroidales bacterium]